MRSSKRNDKEQEEEAEKKKNKIGPTFSLRTIAYSKWAGRFTWTAIIQGAIVALLTSMLAAFVATTGYPIMLVQAMLSAPQVGFSEITALAGLGLYLVVGVIGTGLTAQFYHHFEVRADKPYRGMITNGLAWTHLVLINVGVAAASILMIYAGYLGDIAITEKETGGFGMTIEDTSQQILNMFIVPVSSLLLVTVVGAVAGGAGYIINHLQRREVKAQYGGGKRMV